jgi:hypothetical protein
MKAWTLTDREPPVAAPSRVVRSESWPSALGTPMWGKPRGNSLCSMRVVSNIVIRYCSVVQLEQTHYSRDASMLETIAIVLIVLWILGLVSAYTMGGLIHILLVVAIVVLIFRLLRGRSL